MNEGVHSYMLKEAALLYYIFVHSCSKIQLVIKQMPNLAKP